jgi:hypothetical protein
MHEQRPESVISLSAFSRDRAGTSLFKRTRTASRRRSIRHAVRPTVLLDRYGRIVATRGNLTPFFRTPLDLRGNEALAVLHDDVRLEVLRLIARARQTGKVASGLVILARFGVLAARPIAEPVGDGFVSLSFETLLERLVEAAAE